MKAEVTPSERGKKCLEWLKDSELTFTNRKSIKHAGTQLWLRMENGDEHVTMFVSNVLDDTFSAFTNRPGTNVPACEVAGFGIKAKNVPDAARKLIDFAGIKNTKGLEV